MSNYCIKCESTKRTKKYVTKFGEFSISNSKVDGKIIVTGYRKYKYCEEVDLTFEGKIFARVRSKQEWHSSSILNDSGLRISKVKVNRLIKRNILTEVSHFMKYFDVTIRLYSDIKKINWH